MRLNKLLVLRRPAAAEADSSADEISPVPPQGTDEVHNLRAGQQWCDDPFQFYAACELANLLVPRAPEIADEPHDRKYTKHIISQCGG